jgi:hypothetical protein
MGAKERFTTDSFGLTQETDKESVPQNNFSDEKGAILR